MDFSVKFMRNVDVTKPLESHFDVYAPSFANVLENVNFRLVSRVGSATLVFSVKKAIW